MGVVTAAKTRVPLALAERIAQEALEVFAPACTRIQIAGSIRRRRADVGDVELVAIPKMVASGVDLFGAATGERDALHELAERLLRDGTLTHRPDKNGRPAFGQKFKRVVFHGQAGTLPLDLFVVSPPAQWGVVLTIRTGPGDFSHRLVTPRPHGGLMPVGSRVQDGALVSVGQVVETPEEEDFFRAIGLVWLPPEHRTDDAVPARLPTGR